jgi:hypothetical protein
MKIIQHEYKITLKNGIIGHAKNGISLDEMLTDREHLVKSIELVIKDEKNEYNIKND